MYDGVYNSDLENVVDVFDAVVVDCNVSIRVSLAL
jgi:hypothetical protein